MSFTSNMSEEKENGEVPYPRSKLSPELRYTGSGYSSGRGSPARGFRSAVATPVEDNGMSSHHSERSGSAAGNNGVESWKRAAEVTSQLKARIEQMKVCRRRCTRLHYRSVANIPTRPSRASPGRERARELTVRACRASFQVVLLFVGGAYRLLVVFGSRDPGGGRLSCCISPALGTQYPSPCPARRGVVPR